MKLVYLGIVCFISIPALSQSNAWRKAFQADIIGTWKLISYKEPNDSIFQVLKEGSECTKMNTETHYSFAYFNPVKKTFDMAGGGRYAFKEGIYIETAEYFSLNSKLAGKSFSFEMKIRDDSLFQKSTEPNGLEEYWIRIKSIAGFEYTEVIIGEEKADLPLLVAFHYSGSDAAETLTFYDSIKVPLRIIIPKGNFPHKKGFSYFKPGYYQQDSAMQFSMARKTVDSLAAFVRAVNMKFKTRAIVSGASQGGDISLLLAVYYPRLIKASFPVAAVISKHIRVNTGNRTPVYFFHGETDPIVSIDYTRMMVKSLEKKLPVKLFTYKEIGHDISPAMKTDYSRLIEKLANK